jgi:hypothetical protein
MKNLNINYRTDEARHRGFAIPLRVVKRFILKYIPDEVEGLQIYKTFNPKTGDIERKYAWDTVFHRIHKKVGIDTIYELILKEENL